MAQPGGSEATTDLGSARETYVEALARPAMRDAIRVVSGLARSGVPLSDIVSGVLAPAQVEVGRRWAAGAWSVAQEHTATAITEVALQAAVFVTGGPVQPPEDSPSLVLACADGEWHALGARMAAELLRVHGIGVVYVGPSLPVEDLGDFLTAIGATALGVSCSTPLTLLGARETVRTAHAVGVPVMCAGPAFGSDDARARAIGADAWVAQPAAAADLLRAWKSEPPRLQAADEPMAGWQLVTDDPRDVVDRAFEGLAARRPRLGSFSRPLLQRLHKELGYLVRCLGAALLVGDDRLFAEYAVWLRQVLEVRRVPPQIVDDAYAALADALRGSLPEAAALVDRVAVAG